MRLIETLITRGRVIESDRSKLPAGVLYRGVWPVCNIGKLNANKRMYEEEVWTRKVIGNQPIAEKMKARTLFGQAEHPDKTQSDLQLTSHIITDSFIREYKQGDQLFEGIPGIKEGDKVFFQNIDILDTPCGRIINTLIEAGCQVGVSTRAEGDLEEVTEGDIAPYQRVIPDSYAYVTTDFTADPSTYGTKPAKAGPNLVRELREELQSGKLNKSEKQFATALLEAVEKKQFKAGDRVVVKEGDYSVVGKASRYLAATKIEGTIKECNDINATITLGDGTLIAVSPEAITVAKGNPEPVPVPEPTPVPAETEIEPKIDDTPAEDMDKAGNTGEGMPAITDEEEKKDEVEESLIHISVGDIVSVAGAASEADLGGEWIVAGIDDKSSDRANVFVKHLVSRNEDEFWIDKLKKIRKATSEEMKLIKESKLKEDYNSNIWKINGKEIAFVAESFENECDLPQLVLDKSKEGFVHAYRLESSDKMYGSDVIVIVVSKQKLDSEEVDKITKIVNSDKFDGYNTLPEDLSNIDESKLKIKEVKTVTKARYENNKNWITNESEILELISSGLEGEVEYQENGEVNSKLLSALIGQRLVVGKQNVKVEESKLKEGDLKVLRKDNPFKEGDKVIITHDIVSGDNKKIWKTGAQAAVVATSKDNTSFLSIKFDEDDCEMTVNAYTDVDLASATSKLPVFESYADLVDHLTKFIESVPEDKKQELATVFNKQLLQENTSIRENIKKIRQLKVNEASVRSERDKALELIEEQKKQLKEQRANFEMQINILSEKAEALKGANSTIVALRKVVEDRTKQINEMKSTHTKLVESKSNEVIRIKKEINSQVNTRLIEEKKKIETASNKKLVEAYVGLKVKMSGLTLPRNSQALLEKCSTTGEVDEVFDDIREAFRRGALRPDQVNEIKVEQETIVGAADEMQTAVNEVISVVASGMRH
ncbi:MAG: hypothetical protein WC346_17040 [Methanogenium sp.]|jgi:hypothetical protein